MERFKKYATVFAILFFISITLLMHTFQKNQYYSIKGVVQEKVYEESTRQFIIIVENEKLFTDKETWIDIARGKHVKIEYNGLRKIKNISVLQP